MLSEHDIADDPRPSYVFLGLPVGGGDQCHPSIARGTLSYHGSVGGLLTRMRAANRFDVLLAATTILLVAATAVILWEPQLRLVVVAPGLDLAINTAATVVAAVVAALAWSRYREGRQVSALYQVAAFLGLSLTNAMFVTLTVTGLTDEVGMSLADPGHGVLYVWIVARLAAAISLVAGALAALRPEAPLPHGPLVVPGFVAALAALIGLILATARFLPPLLSPDAVNTIRTHPTVPAILPGVEPAGAFLQAVVGCLFVAGAMLYRTLYLRQRQSSHAYLSLGLVLAGFSQLHFALYPGGYTSLVTSGDVLRVAFYAALFWGIEEEARAQMAALRAANTELQRLYDAEVTRGAVEERARLAREVHDGLAQDLWFAKLKQSRLASLPGLGDEARALAAEVDGAIDSALAEARQAVMALRTGSEQEGPLNEVLAAYVADFGDRFGLLAEFSADGRLPTLPPRTQAELLRIVQEALNNVRKHADATVVRVRAGVEDGRVRLTVTDNGRGFDAAAGDGRSFGLQSMRERAELVGGSLIVESRRRDGARVAVEVPVEGGGLDVRDADR